MAAEAGIAAAEAATEAGAAVGAGVAAEAGNAAGAGSAAGQYSVEQFRQKRTRGFTIKVLTPLIGCGYVTWGIAYPVLDVAPLDGRRKESCWTFRG